MARLKTSDLTSVGYHRFGQKKVRSSELAGASIFLLHPSLFRQQSYFFRTSPFAVEFYSLLKIRFGFDRIPIRFGFRVGNTPILW